MIPPDILELLRCPLTHQRLVSCDVGRLDRVNRAIDAGHLFSRGGEPVSKRLQAALVTEDGRRLYPVEDGIIRLLVDGAIELDALDQIPGS